MTSVLSKDDFVAVRSFLRVLGMGLIASVERATSALDVINAVDPKRLVLGDVALVAESARCGILPSQVVCQNAEKVLKDARDMQQHQLLLETDRAGTQEINNG